MPKLCCRLLGLLILLLAVVVSAASAQELPLNAGTLDRIGQWLDQPPAERGEAGALDLPTGLTRDAAEQSLDQLWTVYRDHSFDEELGDLPPTVHEVVKRVREGGVAPGKLTLGELSMPFVVLRRESNPPPQAGRALFICTHGGGQKADAPGPHSWAVNSREWQTQVQLAAQLYGPDGMYFVPRMADDRKGRWYHAHNQVAFERVAQHAIAHWGVDPNRVYLVGISEGGFGTAILAPFMPDRFGGANAMAAGVGLGNPAENLRNLAFRTDVGENDTMFQRVGLAVAFHRALDAYHAKDADSYPHSINVQPGRGHGIDYRPGVEWIAQHHRNPWPRHITWLGKQIDGQRRARHYWVQIDGPIKDGWNIRIEARVDNAAKHIVVTAEQVQIEGDGGNPTHVKVGEILSREPLTGVALRVLLDDDLIDLDQPLRITVNGEERFNGRVERSAATQLRTLAGYGDPTMSASAEVVIPLK